MGLIVEDENSFKCLIKIFLFVEPSAIFSTKMLVLLYFSNFLYIFFKILNVSGLASNEKIF